ncbi:MAG: archaemetzincin family Zn-dependent metalloprotease [Calditrichia bacterium]
MSSNTIYLAFINNHFPPFWQNLAEDLNRCVPYPFSHLHLDLDLSLFYSGERNQYHSTYLLSTILQHVPDDGRKIIGITDVDIFIPILTFLFGEAQLNGIGAVVSTYRLRNEFYGLPPNPLLLYKRTLKEILHELGHTLGLVHCPNFECIMHSSTYVEDIDLKHEFFCARCQNIIGVNCSKS